MIGYTITTEISVFIECFALIYYSNAVMNYRDTRLKSNLIIIAGYIIYGGICALSYPIANISSFIIINFIVLYAGFSETKGSIALKVIILTALMMFCELLGSIVVNVKIESFYNYIITILEDSVFVLISKPIYFISVIMLKRFSNNKYGTRKTPEMLWLLILPICTCIFLALFNSVRMDLSHELEIVFLILSIMLIIANFVVYIVCDRIADKNERIRYLQEIEHKNEIDFQKYSLLKEKYDDLRVMAHDFNKYYQNIEGMMGDNSDEALALIRKLASKNRELLLVEYTDNYPLNILLTQKSEECEKNGIDLQLYVQNVSLSFINEMDTVAIFANLMDNAIEASRNSSAKKIFLSIYEMNNAFVVIRLDNSANKKPLVSGGTLRTSKRGKDNHGIGMVSISRALKNYGGDIQWSYDKETKTFNTTIMINYLKNTAKN